MCCLRCAVILIYLVVISNCDSSESDEVFDQRQTGEYNIRLSINDVTIIAIDSGSSEVSLNQFQHGNDDAVYEDYDYNLDELTINPFVGLFGKPSTKPPSPSVESSTNLTNKPNVNNIQEIIALQNTNKLEVEATTEPIKQITPPSTTTVVPNVVVIQESTAAPIVLMKPNATVTKKVADTLKPNYNVQHHIPVQVLMEPINIPKRRNNNKQTNLKRLPTRPAVEVVGADKLQEPKSPVQIECMNGKYRDANGRCRRVRKSEGISQLIRLLLNNKKDK